MQKEILSDNGLPMVVYFCKRCVISNQRPMSKVEFKNTENTMQKGIYFDEDGICSACRYNELKEKKIDWVKREKDLCLLLDKYRKNDGGYDVVVPSSGGKDSAFTAHVLKYKYGMHPLTVTWSPHIYTEIGWKNFQNCIHIGGFDNILFTPNGRLHRYLTQQAFLNLLHPFQPFIIGQKIIGPLMASKFDIPLIMYGESNAEYGNDLEDGFVPTMDSKFFSSMDSKEIILGGKKVKDIIKEKDFVLNDFEPYLAPNIDVLESKKISVYHLGYYLKWDPQECYYYAQQNTGFEANSFRTEGTYSKYSSIDDKVDNYHYYTALIKFGIGRATYNAAQEIRNHKITREEGVALVRKFDTEFPKRYFKEFLEYIDITEEQFHITVDKFRPKHLWEKSNGEWKLKNVVYNINE